MKIRNILIAFIMLFSFTEGIHAAREIKHLPRYYIYRIEGYVNSNAWNSAKREIDSGLEDYPDDPDLRYYNGRYYYVIGDMNEARYNLVRATQANDQHYRAKRILVDIEDNLEHYSSAICYINELLEFQPYDRDLWRRKIGLYRKLGNDVEADAALERLAHIYPNDSLVLSDVRRRNYENWDNIIKKSSLSEAADNLERWIDKDPNQREYYLELASVYERMGEFEKAIGAANRGLERFPNDPELINKVAGIMSELGLYAQALTFVKNKRTGNYAYNTLLYDVANDARMNDPYESNGRLYTATHDRDALNYLISTSLTRGYYDDARFYINEAIKRDGRTPALLMKLYTVEKQSGNEKASSRILNELYEMNPEDEELVESYTIMMMKLADNDFITQQWDEAYIHLDRLLELLPDTADAWPSVVSRQIMVLGHLNRLTEARRLYVQSARRSPANRQRFASAYEDIIAVRLRYLIEEEEYVKAYNEAEALLEVVPGSEVALRCLINMSQTLKYDDKFHTYAEMGYELYPDSPYFIVKQAISLQEQGMNSEALALLNPRNNNDEFANPQLTAAYSGVSQEWATHLMENKMPDIAMQVIDSALIYDSNNRELLYTKGLVYESLKMYEKAYKYQMRYYEPSNAEQEDFIQHMRFLAFRSFRNRIDASYTHAFFDTHSESLATIGHLYSVASLSYSRITERNTYTGQISYKGIDGYHEDGENESGGIGLEFMAQWEHEFGDNWTGMANIAASTRFFNKYSANLSVSYAAPENWTPSLRLGYRRTPPTYLYLGGNYYGLSTKDEFNIYILTPSVIKSWERISLTASTDLTLMVNSLYYNVGLKGKFLFNNDNISSITLLTGFGSFPELTFFEQTALRDLSHTNAMVGFDIQYLCSRQLCLGLSGTWNTCYNPHRMKDGSWVDSYRNIYALTLQAHIAF